MKIPVLKTFKSQLQPTISVEGEVSFANFVDENKQFVYSFNKEIEKSKVNERMK